MLMLFVLSCKTWNVIKPGPWLAPAVQQSQNSFPILPTSPALTAGSHSQSGQCPGRLEARSEACSALSLKPKQDYLISLRVSSTLIYRIGILTCLCNEEEEEEKKLLGLKSWTRIQVY